MEPAHMRLKVLALGLFSLSGVWIGTPAIANPTPPALSDSTELPRDCVTSSTSQALPLGEFRTALLETVEAVAGELHGQSGRQMLVSLSEQYACLGQTERVIAIAEQAIASSDNIRHASLRGLVLAEIAGIYGELLNDSIRRDELLAQATELAAQETDSTHYGTHSLIQEIAFQYARLGNYEKAVDTILLIENVGSREAIVRTVVWQLGGMDFTAEATELAEVWQNAAEPNNTVEDSKQDPFTDWIYQLYSPFDAPYSSSDQFRPENAESFRDLQTVQIEALPSLRMQSAAYVQLGIFFTVFGQQELSRPLFELAVQRREAGIATAENPEVLDTAAYDQLMAIALFATGDFEQGLSLINPYYSTPEAQREKADFLIRALIYLPSSEASSEREQLILEAEQILLRQEDGIELSLNSSLFSLAATYYAAGDFENAKRLADELQRIVEEQSRDVTDLYSYGYEWRPLVYLLYQLGEYEQGYDLLNTIEAQDLLPELVARLVDDQQDDLAWATFEDITSPTQQVSALIYMATAYQNRNLADRAFELQVRALDIAQSADLSTDPALEHLSGVYGEDRVASALEEERDGLIGGVLDTSEEERLPALVRLIEDDSRQANLLLEFLPIDRFLNESFQLDELALNDGSLEKLALHRASEGAFTEAVGLVARMQSSYRQATILLEIVAHHANSATPLESETQVSLAEIRQTVQNSSCRRAN